ncbi:hypothetical protein BVK86_22565 [Pseudomonas reinekei]|nr:hypothetical protein BVK86_22565 [Pseudomonas reinekei]
MQVDSELNICIEDPAVTRPLREHLFGVHTGGRGTGNDMYELYDKWQDIINQNRDRRTSGARTQKIITPRGPIASLIEFMQESPSRKNWD